MKKFLSTMLWLFATWQSVGATQTERDLVYKIPGMSTVILRSNIVYKQNPPLQADFYLPAITNPAPSVVIFVVGDASPESLKKAKDWKFMKSYGALAAAHGHAGVTFNHRSSENFSKLREVRSDIQDLISFVRQQSQIAVDKDRICLWFFSGSGIHLSAGVMENNHVKCMAAYYPWLEVPPETRDATEYSAIAQLQKHGSKVPPILLVKAGRDNLVLNQLIDQFQTAASEKKAECKILEHPTGRHAFDIRDDDETSRKIIRETFEFINDEMKIPR